MNFFATAPKGIADLLADELRRLGCDDLKISPSGVAFEGSLAQAYRVCLWSRLANRVLLILQEFPSPDAEALYDGVQRVDWTDHFLSHQTFAVDFSGTSKNIQHTHFGALKVKDAIVDDFRSKTGERPSIRLDSPDIRINLHLQRERATLSLDLSGESLHRRGYRPFAGIAPLKENLAAALLSRANWAEIAANGGALLDPMCGSGTLPIEAALIAGNIAPGLLREKFGFLGWQGHKPHIWQTLRQEATELKELGLKKMPKIVGLDADSSIIKQAWENVGKAGLVRYLHFEKRALTDLEKIAETGLLIANPPYGERLGELSSLKSLYKRLGESLKENFVHWDAAILTSNQELGYALGLRAQKVYSFYNGALPCKLLCFEIQPEHFKIPRSEMSVSQTVSTPLNEKSTMFANRLRKNHQHLSRWAQRENISCYRVYDADIPEYAVAIDIYQQWIHVQEYAPPKEIDPEKAQLRLQEITQIIPTVLQVSPNNVFLKVRQRQRGLQQYQKLSEVEKFYEIQEDNATFLVNFTNYLDTGLFLDHRLTRHQLKTLAKGKRFLNLFCYTGTATVHAALGGASLTTSVDMSHTYLQWAKRNLARNGLSEHRHHFIQANCLSWLRENTQLFDLIFLDPPTFSNSKRMEGVLDIQLDHVELIELAMSNLDKRGILIFSTNHRKFKLDMESLGNLNIENWSEKTLPEDFKRNPKIHQCWKITNR
ncbi:MAG: bifunctional rRNA ((2069)-N(7))-methyltransferase RlmK/23S rRNA [Pseudomonadota bacterium]